MNKPLTSFVAVALTAILFVSAAVSAQAGAAPKGQIQQTGAKTAATGKPQLQPQAQPKPQPKPAQQNTSHTSNVIGSLEPSNNSSHTSNVIGSMNSGSSIGSLSKGSSIGSLNSGSSIGSLSKGSTIGSLNSGSTIGSMNSAGSIGSLIPTNTNNTKMPMIDDLIPKKQKPGKVVKNGGVDYIDVPPILEQSLQQAEPKMPEVRQAAQQAVQQVEPMIPQIQQMPQQTARQVQNNPAVQQIVQENPQLNEPIIITPRSIRAGNTSSGGSRSQNSYGAGYTGGNGNGPLIYNP